MESNTLELFTINPDVVYTFIDHEAIMISSIDEELFGLNETATEVLKQLESAPSSIKNLSDYILENYVINEEQCTVDITNLIESLLAKGLIMRVN